MDFFYNQMKEKIVFEVQQALKFEHQIYEKPNQIWKGSTARTMDYNK